MVEHFKVISDDDYTATLEKRLDEAKTAARNGCLWSATFTVPCTDAHRGRGSDAGRHRESVPAVPGGTPRAKGEPVRPFMGCSRYPKCNSGAR